MMNSENADTFSQTIQQEGDKYGSLVCGKQINDYPALRGRA